MRLVTFERGGAARLGALVDGDATVVDLAASAPSPAFASMQALIEGGEAALDEARRVVEKRAVTLPAAEVRLLSPLPRPVQMRDFMGFEKHVLQAFDQVARIRSAGAPDPEAAYRALKATPQFQVPPAWYEIPVYYKCNRFAVTGTGTEVVWPAYSRLMDFELELAFVIGRGGRDIPAGTAEQHIFGLTIFNDFSARDAQAAEMSVQLGPAKGKDFDDANVLGPCIVTLDEIGDPYDLDMVARVNGEVWGRGNSGDIHHRFGSMIARVSAGETIHPGEVMGSGTVGDGCGLEQGRFLQDGDVVELEIAKIGRIVNRVRRAA